MHLSFYFTGVEQVLKDDDDLAERKNKNTIKLSELISRVCQGLKLVEDEIYVL